MSLHASLTCKVIGYGKRKADFGHTNIICSVELFALAKRQLCLASFGARSGARLTKLMILV